MIYIIRNPILWLDISAYGGGVLSVYFSIDDVNFKHTIKLITIEILIKKTDVWIVFDIWYNATGSSLDELI
jgi:hypothetical protein